MLLTHLILNLIEMLYVQIPCLIVYVVHTVDCIRPEVCLDECVPYFKVDKRKEAKAYDERCLCVSFVHAIVIAKYLSIFRKPQQIDNYI